jgi:hypothetical protein
VIASPEGIVWKGPYDSFTATRIVSLQRVLGAMNDPHAVIPRRRADGWLGTRVLLGSGALWQTVRGNTSDVSYADMINSTLHRVNYLPPWELGIRPAALFDGSILAERLPMSVWAHFALAFVLGIGESDLQHLLVSTQAPTSGKSTLRFVGMTKKRSADDLANAGTLADMMFTTAPSQDQWATLSAKIRERKNDIAAMVEHARCLLLAMEAFVFQKSDDVPQHTNKKNYKTCITTNSPPPLPVRSSRQRRTTPDAIERIERVMEALRRF